MGIGGPYSSGISSALNNVTVTGDSFSSNGGSGVFLGAQLNGAYINVTGNIFSGFGASPIRISNGSPGPINDSNNTVH